MTDHDVTDVIENLTRSIRTRWDRLGFLTSDNGAFATGHTPDVAPHAYLCRFFAGLSDAGLDDAEAESERYLPPSFRTLLKSYNGAHIMGISLNGATGDQNIRDANDGIGQPISIRYQNVFYTRPEYIPEGHFGLGAMNGEWYSQGHLYLTSTGEVEMINSEHNLIGARWNSLAEFLKQEVPRQMSRYDDDGAEIKSMNRLPGSTDEWEALGKESSERRKKEASLLSRTLRKLKRSH